MRTGILGGVLAAAAVAGVYVAVAGPGSPSHCGPCLTCCAPSAVEPPVGDPVTEVVDLTVALAPKAAPSGSPFISFDEPPLAKPARSGPEPVVVQTTFIAPIIEDGLGIIEVAPPPRSRPTEPGKIPLSSPSDPF